MSYRLGQRVLAGVLVLGLTLCVALGSTAVRAQLTVVPFELDAAADIRLSVYDVLGREVAVLVEETRDTGTHEVVFDVATLPSGVYLVRLVAGNRVATQRVTVLR